MISPEPDPEPVPPTPAPPTSGSPTPPAPATPAGCDELISATWVLTVDAAGTVLDDGAVAVDGGRIVAVGTRRDLEAAFRPRRRTHLDGHALVPGFVNAHTHLAMTMFRGLADDLDLAAFLGRLVPAEGAVLDAARVGTATVAGRGRVAHRRGHHGGRHVLLPRRGARCRSGSGPAGDHRPGRARRRPDRIGCRSRRASSGPTSGSPSTRPGRDGDRRWPRTPPTSSAPSRWNASGELARRHDAAIHIHAAETTAEVADVVARHGARPVELLDQLGLLGPCTVLGHGIHLTDDEIGRIAGSGATVAHCPGSNLKLAAGIARVPDLLDAGAGVALGTDGPASSNDLDPFTPMRLAALVHKQSTGDPTVLPAAQVLELATIGGARAVGLADDLGSIESGKLADLVAVSLHRAHSVPVYDPVSAVVYAAGRGDVTRVWAAGRSVVEDSAPVLVDALAVIEEMDPLHDVVLAAVRESPGADHLG